MVHNFVNLIFFFSKSTTMSTANSTWLGVDCVNLTLGNQLDLPPTNVIFLVHHHAPAKLPHDMTWWTWMWNHWLHVTQLKMI